MAVKYQVERRPIGPTGQVYRGGGYGDYIVLPTAPTNLKNLPMGKEDGNGNGSSIYPATTTKFSELGTATRTHYVEINGEPWLVHSTHFSVESALESAAPLAGALGQENVRIIKVLSHKTEFKLN